MSNPTANIKNKTLLIIPCYNEETRLDLAAFRAAPLNIDFLFANDGSTDGTRQILDQLVASLPKDSTRYRAYHAPQNVGKANVIFEAYKSYREKPLRQNYDWVGFWDADLATPLTAVDDMTSFVEKYYSGQPVKAVWGSRIARLGSEITRKPYRHYLGRIFVTVVSTILGVKAYDSQCGAKLFKPKSADVAFEAPFVSRWIFDVEILLRLGQAGVLEFPLLRWTDIPGSKVKIFREMFRVWSDIFLIRKTYLGSGTTNESQKIQVLDS